MNRLLLTAALLFTFCALPQSAVAQMEVEFGGTGNGTLPTIGQVLVGQSNGTYAPQATGTLGLGSGTVTSVGLAVPTGLSVSGSPVTTSGTLTVSYAPGYSPVLTASSTQWAAAYASTTALSNSYIRGLFSNSATGLTYNSSTGGTSLTAGYVIPLSASTTDWGTAYAWGNHATAGYLTAISTSTVRGMLSASSPLSYNSATGAFSFVNPGYITGVAWGDITGTLSAQSDLQAALNAKLSTTSAAATYYPLANPSGYISNITGLVTAGSNISIGGSGTSGDPYQIAGTGGGLATSSPWTAGNVPYVLNNGALSSVATNTPTIGSGLSYSGTFGSVLGGSAGTLSATLGTTIAPNELVGQPFTGGTMLYVSGSSFASVATTTLSGNSQVAVSNSPVVIGSNPAVLSITADSIGDTQLAFNTGQNLTTASSPTFTGLTLTNLTATNATTTTLYASGNVGIGTTSPFARAAIQGLAGQTTPLFQVASSSNDVYFNIGSNGTTTITGPVAATSSAYIYSTASGKGGQIILEDYDGAGCTGIVALNGTLTSATVACPTEI